MNYSCDNDKIFVSISKGDFVNQSLLDVAKINNVNFGWINGIGAIIDPQLGYYDIDNKEYIKKIIKGEFELTSLVGNITFNGDIPFIHSHITFSDLAFKAYGGHLFDCRVAAAGEFIIFKGSNRVYREYSSEIGLNVWNCKI
tara:strand:+ start:1154 stop:1579 length:426 start_codon:yes stop_codon:yes gene_type:complete